MGEETRTSGANPQPQPARVPEVALPRGTVVGRYVVLNELGSGGMSRVYTAFDPELERKVALKLMRSSSALEQQRLLREAQSMARLAHPNVVAVFDAGEHNNGEVFVAMELVEGQDVKAWVAEKKRTWREVLEVYRAAGAGLAAAHDAGIVHRDFKPPNVLWGRDGRVRVGDFGIAFVVDAPEPKAEDHEDSDLTPSGPHPHLTQAGAVVGTTGYLAPEALTGTSLDAKADQFSYAVSLYEALYGERPFAGRLMVDYIRALQKGPPLAPPRGNRVPAWLFKTLRRALAQDPAQRFPSMPALLEAMAKDPATVRVRVALGAGAVALLGLVAWGATRAVARDCTAEARRLDGVWSPDVRAATQAAFLAEGGATAPSTFDRVAARLDSYAASWAALAVRTCSEQGQSGAGEELRLLRGACLERRRGELAALTQVLAAADAQTVSNAISAAAALPDPGRCESAKRLRADVAASPKSPELSRRTAHAHALFDAGHLAEALKEAKACAEEGRKLGLGAELAGALLVAGLVEEAETDFKQAVLDLTEGLRAAETARDDELTLRIASVLIIVLSYEGRFPEAKMLLRTIDVALSRVGDDELMRAEALRARFYASTDETQAEGIRLATEEVELRSRVQGPDHPDTQRARGYLASAYGMSGRLEESVELDLATLTFIESALGRNHPARCKVLCNVGSATVQLGRLAEGEKLLVDCVECARAVHGDKSPRFAFGLANLSWLYVRTDRAGRAAEASKQAMDILEGGEVTDDLAIALTYRGFSLLAEGKVAEALTTCERAVPMFEKIFGAAHPYLSIPLECLGEAQRRAKKSALAIASLTHALTLVEGPNNFVGDRADARFFLAQALWDDPKQRDRARALALTARDELASVVTRSADVQAIDTWLTKHRR